MEKTWGLLCNDWTADHAHRPRPPRTAAPPAAHLRPCNPNLCPHGTHWVGGRLRAPSPHPTPLQPQPKHLRRDPHTRDRSRAALAERVGGSEPTCLTFTSLGPVGGHARENTRSPLNPSNRAERPVSSLCRRGDRGSERTQGSGVAPLSVSHVGPILHVVFLRVPPQAQAVCLGGLVSSNYLSFYILFCLILHSILFHVMSYCIALYYFEHQEPGVTSWAYLRSLPRLRHQEWGWDRTSPPPQVSSCCLIMGHPVTGWKYHQNPPLGPQDGCKIKQIFKMCMQPTKKMPVTQRKPDSHIPQEVALEASRPGAPDVHWQRRKSRLPAPRRCPAGSC